MGAWTWMLLILWMLQFEWKQVNPPEACEYMPTCD